MLLASLLQVQPSVNLVYRFGGHAMLVHCESPMHVILECQEMEYRETPAVMMPGMEAVPTATAVDTAPAQAGTISPTPTATEVPTGSSPATPQGTTANPPSTPSVSNPFGSFALPSRNTSQTDTSP
jgi:hypothetical protein